MIMVTNNKGERIMKNQTKINIPKKYHSMLTEVYQDSDGYWAYAKLGYYFTLMDSHTACEDTQNGLLKVIRSLSVCDCEECKNTNLKTT